MWQREWLEGGALEEGLKYWKEQLAGIPERLELPTDGRGRGADVRGRGVPGNDRSGQVEKLKRLGREEPGDIIYDDVGGFGVLLSRYSGQDDHRGGVSDCEPAEKCSWRR